MNGTIQETDKARRPIFFREDTMANLNRLTDAQVADEVSIYLEAVDRCMNGSGLQRIHGYVWRQFAFQVAKVRAKRALEK